MDTGVPFLTQPIFDAIMADNSPQGVSKGRAEAPVTKVQAAIPEATNPLLQQIGWSKAVKWVLGTSIGTSVASMVGYNTATGEVDPSSALSFFGQVYHVGSMVPWPAWLVLSWFLVNFFQGTGKKVMDGLRSAYRDDRVQSGAASIPSAAEPDA
jgi:hypothetical protein